MGNRRSSFRQTKIPKWRSIQSNRSIVNGRTVLAASIITWTSSTTSTWRYFEALQLIVLWHDDRIRIASLRRTASVAFKCVSFHVTAFTLPCSRPGRLPRLRIMNPEQPDFSNARTLHFPNNYDGDNVKDESARSDRGNIFDNIYKLTIVNRYVYFIAFSWM